MLEVAAVDGRGNYLLFKFHFCI